jgi:hypothetical protein
MAARPLDVDTLRATLEIVGRHGIVAGAKMLGIPRNTFVSRWQRARVWAAESGVPCPAPASGVPVVGGDSTPAPAPQVLGDALLSVTGARRLPSSSDEAWLELDKWIGRSAREMVTPGRAPESGRLRVCVAGDFHSPFYEPALVAQLIAEEGPRTDLLVINGDLQDFYSISRFVKYETVTIEDELAAVDALLGRLSAAFPEVLVVCGNHDRPRFEKQLRSLVPADLVKVIEFLSGGELDVLRVIGKRYPNVRFARHGVGRHAVGWFAQVGDLIVTHAEKFSRVPGAALRGIEEWLADRRDVLGLAPWRVLIQAHTHQMGVFPWHADRLLIEGGCMCQTHGYQLDARIAGRPQRRGYVTLTQYEGVTDLNSVRTFWWDVSGRATHDESL